MDLLRWKNLRKVLKSNDLEFTISLKVAKGPKSSRMYLNHGQSNDFKNFQKLSFYRQEIYIMPWAGFEEQFVSILC